jgi:hypothetical protein
MRLAALLLAASVMYAQSGKPGPGEPIKDPQQIPGNAHPGPIPRVTPQPSTSTEDGNRSRKTEKKKEKKQTKQKTNRQEK